MNEENKTSALFFGKTASQLLPDYVALKSEAKNIYGNDSKPLTAWIISKYVCTDLDKIDNKIDLVIAKLKALLWTKSIID